MRQRTSYPKLFKNQVVQECLQPGASVASVAMSHGINANVVRKWLPLYRDRQLTDVPAFLPVKLEPNIQNKKSVSIELPCGQGTINVKWPASDPDGCARFVRGLTQ
ncbi:transposase [Pseudomonas donghuensis]|nr:transposase [Pseudomonas donghuensis]